MASVCEAVGLKPGNPDVALEVGDLAVVEIDEVAGGVGNRYGLGAVAFAVTIGWTNCDRTAP